MLATPPTLLPHRTVIIKQPRHLPAWKTNKTKVSSYFGLFFYLLSFLPFYVKSPQQAGRGRGWHTHVSFVVRTNKHSRRTIRNLRKKAKVEEEAEEEGQLPVSLSELLFVARVRDLLNLWNYFTCISDSRSVCSNLPLQPHSLPILVFVPSIWSIPAAVIVLFRRLISSGFTYHVAWQNFYATSYVAG